MDDLVQLEVTDVGAGAAFAVLTLNRSRAKNSINKALSNRLAQVLNDVRLRESVRCIVVTGSGGSFSAGIDLKCELALL